MHFEKSGRMFADGAESLQHDARPFELQPGERRGDFRCNGDAIAGRADLDRVVCRRFRPGDRRLGRSRRAPRPSPFRPCPCQARECNPSAARWLWRRRESAALSGPGGMLGSPKMTDLAPPWRSPQVAFLKVIARARRKHSTSADVRRHTRSADGGAGGDIVDNDNRAKSDGRRPQIDDLCRPECRRRRREGRSHHACSYRLVCMADCSFKWRSA